MAGFQKSSFGAPEGEVFYGFIETIVEKNEPYVKRLMASIRETRPDLGEADIANEIIFSGDLATPLREIPDFSAEDVKRRCPLLTAGTLNKDLCDLVVSQITLVQMMANLFPRHLQGLPVAQGALVLLLASHLPPRDQTYAFSSIDDVKAIIKAHGNSGLGKEALFHLRNRQLWKKDFKHGEAGTQQQLVGATKFLFLRDIALTAKYLFRAGSISDADRRNYRKIGDDILSVMLKAMIAAGIMDGEIEPEKKDIIQNFCEHFGLQMPTLQFQTFDPSILDQVKKLSLNQEQKLFFFHCLWDMVRSHGSVYEVETSFLGMAAEALGQEIPKIAPKA